MKILYLNSVGVESWGGGEKWMFVSASGLRDRGHRIFVAGRRDSLFLERFAADAFPTLPLQIRGDFDIATILALRGFIREHQIDVIIANFNKDVRLAGLARKLMKGTRLIARNGLPILHNNWRYRLSYKSLVDGIITNTEAIKKRYLGYGWMKDDFIRVIHNGIDTSVKTDYATDEVREKFKLPPQRPVIGIFGRLVPQKQHHIFMEVAKQISEKYQEAQFLVVGDGPLREDVMRLATDMSLLENTFFPGFQSNVFPFYAYCDLILLTSDDEGLPNVVMESMLCGRSVVAFDVGGVRELIPRKALGRVVAPNDIAAMTRESLELLGDDKGRAETGAAARQHIVENFSVEKMVEKVEAVIVGTKNFSPLQ